MPLNDAEQNKEDGSEHADRCIGRKQADAERAQSHDEHRQHQHRFAAEPVAEMAEQCAAERPRQKSHRIAAERRQRAGERIDGGEEGFVEHECRGSRVDQEVVPFDDGSDAAGEHDGSHFRVRRTGGGYGRSNAHLQLLISKARGHIPLERTLFQESGCKAHAGFWREKTLLLQRLKRINDYFRCGSRLNMPPSGGRRVPATLKDRA